MRFYRIAPIIFQWLIRLCTRFVFFTFAHLKVHGLSHLEMLEAPVIFAANHLSEWDGPLIRSAMPMRSQFGPMFYVARGKGFYDKSGWRKYFYESPFFRLLGAYPAYTGTKDYAQALEHHIAILKDGGSVTIFPEGKRSTDGTIGEPKAGVVALSLMTKRPIVPVAINGLENLNVSELFSGKRHVSIAFGEPLLFEELPNLVVPEDPETYKLGAVELMKRVSVLRSVLGNELTNKK